MNDENTLVVFQDKKIRREKRNGEWFFSVIDVIGALTDSANPRNYWNMLKARELEHGIELYTLCVQLKLKSADAKERFTDCANTRALFRIIQSVPSRKAEPFKLWLAKLGHERIQEIENPELAQDRVKQYYEIKGYPGEWIEKRLRGIAIRQELTDEWKNRKISQEKDYAILTNEISKAAFGKTVQEYKEFKDLEKKNQNLRDHMTDWEIILTMVGEKATTDITVAKDSQGFDECKTSAQKGGRIASNTRKEVEQETGKSVVSNNNFLNIKEKKKLEEQKKNKHS